MNCYGYAIILIILYRVRNLYYQHFYGVKYSLYRHVVVGRVPAFQPGGLGSIPGGVRNFNSYPGIDCVSFAFCPVPSVAEALTLC